MKLHEIHALQEAIERIPKAKQSAQNERDKARMEFQLRVALAEREIVVAKRAAILFDAFWKNGRMEVAHPYGQRLDYDGSPHGVSEIQLVWNVRGQADTLSNWSEP